MSRSVPRVGGRGAGTARKPMVPRRSRLLSEPIGSGPSAALIYGTIQRRRCMRMRVKIYDLEVQRLKSSRHDKGVLEFGIDVLVLPRPQRDDVAASSSLRVPVEQARSLLLLLKQQLAEIDSLQPRSRRSGRS